MVFVFSMLYGGQQTGAPKGNKAINCGQGQQNVNNKTVYLAVGRSGKESVVLQLRLQQRRTREQLVDQGIMPSLKSPAAFHGQIRSLERARTENFLKHKIRSRPERAELIRMHILQETGAEPSLQATQMRLKRARLADNLNEMISQRPGPMELVEKNILPVDSSVKQAIIGERTVMIAFRAFLP
ncbi:MKL/myocardin-like protein 2 [Notothenia coriiceps]|uniref:Phosphatase and actin regulator n=1 Tax=Notothenia coriiceps TaxID=8208 RepID=A0A6I9NQW9_9TELE|nr:PREDICTED: MKL/myocardin-like protein 2 [Notothenia coriiceps]